jgi:hypothetical protein
MTAIEGANMDEYRTTIARDKMVREDFYAAIRSEYPLRVRVAARLGGAVVAVAWVIGKRLPHGRYHELLWGGGWDEGAIQRWVGRTICRHLGHWWELCGPPGSPSRNVGHTLFCTTCAMLASTDDLDSFEPGSRERRDAAALGCELDALCWTARYCHPWPQRKSA